jgi:hypothetical protein
MPTETFFFSLTESIVDAHGPSHALLTLDGREDLCAVLERDWTLTETVACIVSEGHDEMSERVEPGFFFFFPFFG